MRKGELMNEIIDTIIEIILLICITVFVITKQDMRLIVQACAVYIASVIRHSGKENR